MRLSLFSFFLIIVISLSGCSFITKNNDVFISSKTPAKPPASLNVYGTLVDFYEKNELNVLKIQSEIVNWEINNSYLEIEVNDTLSNLVKSDKYVFFFWEKTFEKVGPWDDVKISKNLTKYKLDGAWHHEKDLTRDQRMKTGGEENKDQMAVSISPTSMVLGQPTNLTIILINKQNDDIEYKIIESKIADAVVYSPFIYKIEEKSRGLPDIDTRLSNAIVSNCNVDYDNNKHIIQANSSKILSFSVVCTEPIIRERTYESCDIQGKNCRTSIIETEFLLWGKLEFVDELGNKHVFPEKGILKQFLEIL